MAATPNLTKSPVSAGLNITAAMGTTIQDIYTAPAVNANVGGVDCTGGAKITRIFGLNKDTATASVYLQLFRKIGAVSFPVGDPVSMPAGAAKGVLVAGGVDLLQAAYGPGGAMNMAPGEVLQCALSVAIGAAGLSVVVEGASF